MLQGVTGVLTESKHVITGDSQRYYRQHSRVVIAVLQECYRRVKGDLPKLYSVARVLV